MRVDPVPTLEETPRWPTCGISASHTDIPAESGPPESGTNDPVARSAVARVFK